MSQDAKTLYTTALRNTHAEEKQGLVQMKAQLGRLADYPEYEALIQSHIARTESQLSRLEQALADVDAGTSGVKEAITGAAGAIGAAIHGATGHSVLKDLYAGYAYQYHQIAAYRSLAVIAQAAGFANHGTWIARTIEEEQAAAERVAALIEPVTSSYLAKAE